MGAYKKLKNIILSKANFLLIGHVNPDGDSIGSTLSFAEFLKDLGKRATVICRDDVPEVFKFMPGSETIKNDFLLGNYEAVILLDNGDFRRTGFADRLSSLDQKKIPVVNIDHHRKNDLWKFVAVNYTDEEASSTSEIIYEIMKGLRYEINPKIATLLLCGIYNDTGGFKHTNTSKKVLEICSDLLSRGAKLKLITQNLSNSKSISMLKLWGIALDRLITNEELGITSSVLFEKDIQEADASEADVSGLVNLLNTAAESRISLLLYEASDGKIKGSLRTESEGVDVSRLANFLGGGGHKKASGFSLDGKIVADKKGWKIL